MVEKPFDAETDAKMRAQFGTQGRLMWPLVEYWKAIGDRDNPDMFSAGYAWADKHHRLVYDLIGYALALEAKASAAHAAGKAEGQREMRERAANWCGRQASALVKLNRAPEAKAAFVEAANAIAALQIEGE